MQTKESQTLDYERVFMEQKKTGNHAFRTLHLLYKGQYSKLALSLLFYILKHSPVWIIPIVTANMINIVTYPEKHSMTELWINVIVVVIVIAQNIPGQLMHIKLVSDATRQVEAGLRGTLIRKLQHLSISYHSELRSGKLQAKVLRDVEQIELLSKQIMQALLPAVLNVIVAISYTLTRSLSVAAFFIIAAPFAMGLVYVFRTMLQTRNRMFRKQIEAMSGQVAETVEMIPVTRAHGLQELEIRKMDTALQSLKGKGQKLDFAEALFGSSGWVSFQLFQVGCLVFTIMLALDGKIPIGDVVMYQGFFGTIMMSINGLINVYPQITRGFESIYSVSELLVADEMEEYQGKRKPERIEGSFRFENLHFHYRDTDKHVLRSFNLDVRAGETIAFVGESGAGKSTVLNMVVGFYRPTEGRILVDGIPMDELDMISYRQRLAVVPQNTLLFSGSIRDNITYGLDNVPEEQLQRVIEMANLQDVVAAMPNGLDTLIGEHGGKLSGGQRQRIAIARAMIRDPQVIILDEATSALDNISEYMVQKAMQQLIQGRTTFIVAHRLSTIRDADRIVVMSNGQCVEVGTYEDLMERRGEFYRLKQLQA